MAEEDAGSTVSHGGRTETVTNARRRAEGTTFEFVFVVIDIAKLNFTISNIFLTMLDDHFMQDRNCVRSN